MYIVAHGHINILNFSTDGHRTFLARDGRGRTIGEIEAISGEHCAATCETGDNTTLLFCPEPQLLAALSNIQFVRNLTAIFYKQMVRNNYFAFVDRYSPVDQRLFVYLLMFSQRRPEIHDTQAFLAEAVGCSRQTINRELGKLKDAGIIDLHKGGVVVLQRERLEKLLVDYVQ